MHVSPDRSLLAAGDDLGGVFLYRFPVVKNTQQCVRMTGHSEHVPRVRFTDVNKGKDATHVISVGGNDKAVM